MFKRFVVKGIVNSNRKRQKQTAVVLLNRHRLMRRREDWIGQLDYGRLCVPVTVFRDSGGGKGGDENFFAGQSDG